MAILTGCDTPPQPGKGSLGTFGGVFTPSILTILGIILFMRLGYVVGNAGLKHALIIIVIANVISLLTTFSLSAIATNLKVKGGGDYYLISRTLGVEFGGALGLVIFLAQSVSIAFYCIGFGEALDIIINGESTFIAQIIAACAAAVLFCFALIGADWATKFQFLVMGALAASLVSFFAGGFSHWDNHLLQQNWAAESRMDFWLIFAIFFPAVTGFTQGVSMSGDLKNPGRSLPLGTFLAVGVSVIVYLGATFVFAAGLPTDKLGDKKAMSNIASYSWLIDVGVIAATLSSAMASFLGAPRILQSVAKDRIFPILKPFAKGSGPLDNPRRGVILSAIIAFAVISMGKLNIIAPVVSMFFLISYGLLNYATYFEARANSPSFRPRFRWFHYRLSLVGSLACLGVMIAIDLTASVIGIAILLAIHQYLKRTAGPARWADSKRSYHFQLIREHLFSIDDDTEASKDWRPRLLVFSRNQKRREQLLRFSSWIEGGAGFTTAVTLIEGHGAKARKLQKEAEDELRNQIAQLEMEAFSRVVTTDDILDSTKVLIQSYGIGPVRANSVVINWRESKPQEIAVADKMEKQYGRYLRAALSQRCNIIVLDTDKDEWESVHEKPSSERRIDVWWWDDPSSRFMLLLAYLMTRNDDWNDAKIRVLASCNGKDDDVARSHLEQMLDEARIDGEPEILNEVTAVSMVEMSRDATLVFLPLRIKQGLPVDPFGRRLEELFTLLPTVAMVIAAENIPLDAEPDDS